jgi:hypothetical protein
MSISSMATSGAPAAICGLWAAISWRVAQDAAEGLGAAAREAGPEDLAGAGEGAVEVATHAGGRGPRDDVGEVVEAGPLGEPVEVAVDDVAAAAEGDVAEQVALAPQGVGDLEGLERLGVVADPRDHGEGEAAHGLGGVLGEPQEPLAVAEGVLGEQGEAPVEHVAVGELVDEGEGLRVALRLAAELEHALQAAEVVGGEELGAELGEGLHGGDEDLRKAAEWPGPGARAAAGDMTFETCQGARKRVSCRAGGDA